MGTVVNFATVQKEGNRTVTRQMEYYNLDMILSIGYRVKLQSEVKFRIWANKILKDYLLKGYVLNQRIENIEAKLTEHDEKINLFIKTSLPPVEGIFFDGQLFDAYKFAADLIKSARKSIVLIDNYVDESVLMLLTKRNVHVTAVIYTVQISKQLALDLQRHKTCFSVIPYVSAIHPISSIALVYGNNVLTPVQSPVGKRIIL